MFNSLQPLCNEGCKPVLSFSNASQPELICHSIIIFFCICPSPELLSVLGPLERDMMPTLDAALLCSSRVGSDLGCKSDWLRSFVNWVHSSNQLSSGFIYGTMLSPKQDLIHRSPE